MEAPHGLVRTADGNDVGHDETAHSRYAPETVAAALALQSVPAALIRCRPDRGDAAFEQVNEAWAALAGTAGETTLGMPVAQSVSSHLLQRLLRATTSDTGPTALTPHADDRIGGFRVSVDCRVVEVDGPHRRVLVHARPDLSGDDSETLPAVLDALDAAVVLVDRRLRIRWANATATALFDTDRGGLVGKGIDVLTGSADSHEDIMGILASSRSRPSRRRVVLRLAGGREVDAVVGTTAITSPMVGVVLTVRRADREPGDSVERSPTAGEDRARIRMHIDALRRRVGTTEVCIACFDLDDFKTVNDAIGRERGDELLDMLAERLRTLIGAHGIAARLGGDEFVVVGSGPDDDPTIGVIRVIERALGEPVGVDGRELQLTASIGVATTTSAADDTQRLLSAADTAMYEAKRRGKDRVAVYDESLHRAASDRLEMESDLRHAIERDELILHYQPIIDVVTGRPMGAEALIRWVHPARGLVRPDLFIPLAESTGLIIPIGAWVLETAVTQVAAWNRARRRRKALAISVNLSGHQLADPNLVSQIRAVLARTGHDPSKLTMEVTESTLMTDTEATTTVLESIRSLGVRIAIDDFGTGYSSLAYLKRFPAGTLKIDRAFVDGLGIDAEDTALVTGIVGLASALDLAIVAEGVETETHLRELRRLGCEYSQGYLHSKPLAAEDFELWLERVDPDARARELTPIEGDLADGPTSVDFSSGDRGADPERRTGRNDGTHHFPQHGRLPPRDAFG